MDTPTGGARLLTNLEMLRIHETMLAILRDPGLEVELPAAAYGTLRSAGVDVEPVRRRAMTPIC